MKKFVLMIFTALICGLLYTSCSKENNANSALNIYAFSQSTTKSESENGDMFLWITGNNIKWYNSTTGELKLNNIPNVPFMTLFRLTVFLDDIELFSLETVNPLLSKISSFPCINWEPDGEWLYKGCKCGNKQDHITGRNCEPIWEYTGKGGSYFINMDYPIWTQAVRDEMAGIMGQDWLDSLDAEFEAFEYGWNKFIEQLKKEGKYRK